MMHLGRYVTLHGGVGFPEGYRHTHQLDIAGADKESAIELSVVPVYDCLFGVIDSPDDIAQLQATLPPTLQITVART
jgi:hypothetical protein